MLRAYRRPRLCCACTLAGLLVVPGAAVTAATASTQDATAGQTAPPPQAAGPTRPHASESRPALGTPLGQAELPPVPNLLDDAAATPASPYALPRLTTSPTPRPAATIKPDAEPLWVLPEAAIPQRVVTVPGAEPVRNRGYLDRPAEIDGILPEPMEPDSGRLEQGLDWPYCGTRPPGSESAGPAAPTDPGAAPTDLAAGGISYQRKRDLVSAVGGVTVVRGSQRIEADTLEYERRRETVTSTGTTYLQYPQLRISGTGAVANLETEQARLDAPRFRLSGPINARGRANTAYVVSPTRSAYRDILYTTCPPGSNAWTLRAETLKLDQDTGLGVARDARLRVRGVPVLYTPYLQFPIDDRRRSGFLIPSFGSSDDNGVEVLTPYYWNVAPQMDATFAPRWMSRRGMLLGSDVRYLTRADNGQIQAEILPDDRQYEDGDATRWAFGAEEDGRWLGGQLRTQIDFGMVSDDEYLQDFGNTIDATSSRRINQRGQALYATPDWSLLLQLHGFQTIDTTVAPRRRPYARLPQLLFRLSPRELLPRSAGWLAGYPTLSLDAEYDYFDHRHKVYGQRFTATPVLGWPLQRNWGHLIPRARVYLSQYELLDAAPAVATNPGHAIPSVDLDGKLIFERDVNWLDEAALQTLEPRLYYLYTPFTDQDDIPVFDSSELDFSFANLYRNNRFTGRDRIGDANQLTAGFSSRMLRAATGAELFRISLGQIHYFADRRVQIAGVPETDSTSPYTGELSARLFDHWSGRASFQWDPDTDGDPLPRRTLRLEYEGPERTLLNMAYRTDLATREDNRYEDTDLAFRLPFGTRAELVGRWLYSVRHGETMDAFAGIELGKCCWRLRILGRQFKRRPEDPASLSVMVQIELAGLGAIGDPIGEFLDREIYGYAID
jgi:LPS-assembly protein